MSSSRRWIENILDQQASVAGLGPCRRAVSGQRGRRRAGAGYLFTVIVAGGDLCVAAKVLPVSTWVGVHKGSRGRELGVVRLLCCQSKRESRKVFDIWGSAPSGARQKQMPVSYVLASSRPTS